MVLASASASAVNEIPKMSASSVSVPGGSPTASCLCRRLSKISKWVWARLLWTSCLSAGTRACETLHVPFKSKVFVSYSPPALPNVSPAGVQSLTFWGLIFPMLRLLCLDPLLLGRTSAFVISLSFVGHRPGDMAGPIFAAPTSSFWFLLYIFNCGKFFLLIFRLFSVVVAL